MSNRPYAERCFTILLHGGARWSVHQSVLHKSSVLARRCSQATDHTLDLRNIHEDTAHVLVHYLYTGSYQTLEAKRVSRDRRKADEFKSNLRVYAASRDFALLEMETTAKIRVERLGEELPIFDRLTAAREAHLDPKEDDTWFQDYLKTCIRDLLGVFPASPGYGSLGFLGQMSTFTKAIVKSALEIACESTAHLGRFSSASTQLEEAQRSRPASTFNARESQVQLDSNDFQLEAVDAYEGSTQFELIELPVAENGLRGIETTHGEASATPHCSPEMPKARPQQDQTPRGNCRREPRLDSDLISFPLVGAEQSGPMISHESDHSVGPHNEQDHPSVSKGDRHSTATVGGRPMPLTSMISDVDEESYQLAGLFC